MLGGGGGGPEAGVPDRGKRPPQVDRAIARLRGRFVADAVELLDTSETDGESAVAACNALALFGAGDRLIVVGGTEAWKADDAKAIAAYLRAPSPGTVLALVPHDTGRLVWAGEGRNQDTLGRFFDELGAERAALLTHVSCDGAEWIHAVVRARAPLAVICLDPFHVVAWALKALDKVRVRTMTRAGISDRHAMWAVRDPPDLTGRAAHQPGRDRRHRSHALPGVSAQGPLRELFGSKPTGPAPAGRVAVVGVALAHPRVRRARPQHPPLPRPDLNTLDHGLSNAESEATNTHLRALTKRAYGFHSPDALIAMALLTRGGLCPPLPGRK